MELKTKLWNGKSVCDSILDLLLTTKVVIDGEINPKIVTCGLNNYTPEPWKIAKEATDYRNEMGTDLISVIKQKGDTVSPKSILVIIEVCSLEEIELKVDNSQIIHLSGNVKVIGSGNSICDAFFGRYGKIIA